MPLYFPATGGSASTRFSLSGDAGQVAAPGNTNINLLAGCQHVMPAATLALGKEVSIRITGEKLGTTGTNVVTGTIRLHVGTAGTTADAALANSVQIALAADTETFGYEVSLRVVTATTLRRFGPGGIGTSNGRTGQNVTARPAADSIPNISGQLYWSLSCQMGAGTPEYVTINQFEIIVL